MSPRFSATAVLAATGLMSVAATPPLAIGRAGMPGKDVALFHPGRSSLASSLTHGKTRMAGFTLQAGHTARRFHEVSAEQSLVFDQGNGDVVAVKK